MITQKLKTILQSRLSGDIIAILRNKAGDELEFTQDTHDELIERILLLALDYVGDEFFVMDDFHVYWRNIIDCEKSFKKLISLTEKDLRKSGYRQIFCRLISFAEKGCDWDEISMTGDWDKLDYSINIRIRERLFGIKGGGVWVGVSFGEFFSRYEDDDDLEKLEKYKLVSATGFYGFKQELNPLLLDPFYGSIFGGHPVTDKRKFHELCTRILMALSEDPVEIAEVAEKYSEFADIETLAAKANLAIEKYDFISAEKIIKIIENKEKNHPALKQIKQDLSRITKIEDLRISGILDIDQLNLMTGEDFEALLASKFKELGWSTITTPKTGDFGADLLVTSVNGTKVSVQCKRYKTKVNLKAVQEVAASMSHYQCDYGVVVTNSSFLKSAQKLAESHDIELWDKNRLVDFLAGDLSFSELASM